LAAMKKIGTILFFVGMILAITGVWASFSTTGRAWLGKVNRDAHFWLLVGALAFVGTARVLMTLSRPRRDRQPTFLGRRPPQ